MSAPGRFATFLAMLIFRSERLITDKSDVSLNASWTDSRIRYVQARIDVILLTADKT
jgi:hypothetical protein